MGTLSKSSDDLVFRLVGEVEGVHREFILAPGDHRVGSLSENEIDIQASDVSRRHAVIHVNAETVHLKDLRSTNGTFVNGVQVTRSDLAADDWIQFGSVLLTLERVANADLELGIELEPRVDDGSDDRHHTERTTQLGRTRDRLARWMALANETVAGILGADNEDFREALDRFRAGLEATTVAVLVLEETDTARVHSLAGDAAVLDKRQIQRELSQMKWSSPKGFAGLYRAGPPARIVVAHNAGPRTHHVLAVCGGGLDEDLVPVCELVLRTALHEAPIAPVEAAPEAGPPQLVFPDDHVQGLSQASRRMYSQIAALRNGTTPVLIVGETGVGKEHVVQILHASSDRAHGPMRVINCAAIPADLLEAELFGIEAGVATGVAGRKGAFREADGGTLFFDEIGAMPLPLQAKLLRVVQESEVHPIGARHPVPVDVRIVAATNADLAAAIESETFRSDLYYRIAGCEINVAPLRKRREDIPALVSLFLEISATDSAKRIRGVSVSALTKLQNATWPGNVRQLEHEIRRLVSLCPDGATIESHMISPEITAADSLDDEIADHDLTLKHHVDALERRLIRRAVDQANGNLAQAARLLGLSRNGLVMKMGRLGVSND